MLGSRCFKLKQFTIDLTLIIIALEIYLFKPDTEISTYNRSLNYFNNLNSASTDKINVRVVAANTSRTGISFRNNWIVNPQPAFFLGACVIFPFVLVTSYHQRKDNNSYKLFCIIVMTLNSILNTLVRVKWEFQKIRIYGEFTGFAAPRCNIAIDGRIGGLPGAFEKEE